MEGRRQAPKRSVREVRRRGQWGDVVYEHHLDCGHTEIRERASRARRIACTWCQKLDERKEQTNTTPSASLGFSFRDDGDDSAFASAEIEISQARASLASFLKVPVDAVEIVASEKMGMLEIRAAYIFLSAQDIRRLLERGNENE